MTTPIDTTMNAVNVPIETMSMSLSNGTKAASRLTTTATMMVLFTGVMLLGFTLANIAGNRPSRPIANRMRVWPYIVTRVTEKIEMSDDAATTVLQPVDPVTSSRIC